MELSIFADADLIDTVFQGECKELLERSGVEVCEDTWIALQVEQHDDDSWEFSGGRVRDISAPLAAEGISILFLSTWISDVSVLHVHNINLKLWKLMMYDKCGYDLLVPACKLDLLLG